MYPVGSAPCSPQSPLLLFFTPFLFYQLTSGFRIPNFSGFRILYQCRFWIPIHWILDSKNSKFRGLRIPGTGRSTVYIPFYATLFRPFFKHLPTALALKFSCSLFAEIFKPSLRTAADCHRGQFQTNAFSTLLVVKNEVHIVNLLVGTRSRISDGDSKR